MSPRARRWALAAAIVAAVALAVWVGAESDALARVGGGGSFSRGGSSGGSRGGGSSGGGADGDLIFLLIWMLIEYPALGVPLVLLVGVIWFVTRDFGPKAPARFESHGSGAGPRDRVGRGVAGREKARPSGLPALVDRDPGFSLPVFLDFAVLVHRRALESSTGKELDPALAPFVAPEVQARLRAAWPGVRQVFEVVAGGAALLKVEVRGEEELVFVRIESTRLHTVGSGQKDSHTVRLLVEEVLVFRRAMGATSTPPERLEALACPSCGNPIEVDRMGACTSCGSPITKGQLQWQLAFVDRKGQRPAESPRPHLGDGGDEPSVRVPVVRSRTLAKDLATLQAWDEARFGARLRVVYGELQRAWSDGRWQRARPFVTDRLYQTLRLWMEQYAEVGLRNQLDQIELLGAELVDASRDRYVESVTVRIVGRMVDVTLDAAGKVVGGNPTVPRRFSEYWTLVRSAEGVHDGRDHGTNCPSCGAGLDRVDETGVCGYCDAKISGGKFDWVLSRIEQPEAYR